MGCGLREGLQWKSFSRREREKIATKNPTLVVTPEKSDNSTTFR